MGRGGDEACLYAFEGMADWEYGYLVAELKSGRYFRPGQGRVEVRLASQDMKPCSTMGGLRVLPDLVLEDLRPEDWGLLILPGGDSWLEPRHGPILDLARRFLEAGKPVAAICGATLALGAAGILDDRAHTSNDLGYLKATCPSYKGEGLYRQEPAVVDRKLVTASGLAPLEFAQLTLGLLGVMDDRVLKAWKALYLEKSPQAFGELMGALHA